nr:MAG TPA: hypothetical protein [Crassvirales sp.]
MTILWYHKLLHHFQINLIIIIFIIKSTINFNYNIHKINRTFVIYIVYYF